MLTDCVDTDYICNWFGGEAVSLALQYKYASQFRSSGYTPFMYGGKEYGEVREYGNFSFTRIYEAGHTVPYYQRESQNPSSSTSKNNCANEEVAR